MGLLSLFKRHDESPAEPPATPDAVAQARRQARRRLIGATVLLAAGVIGFPLLFETQPRPVRMDIPIEIPRKDGVAPLVMPPAAAPAAAAVAPPVETAVAPARPATPASAASRAGAFITERPGEQGREIAAAAPRSTAVTPASAPGARPAVVGSMAVAPASAAALAAGADDGERARAILEGQSPPSASAATQRVVVQVGAYTDADKLREARQKVERLGLKTYTQVVDADGATRTRVRVGPFPSKAEADKAAARIKAAGLPAAVLTL